jgi:hypothetical protein
MGKGKARARASLLLILLATLAPTGALAISWDCSGATFIATGNDISGTIRATSGTFGFDCIATFAVPYSVVPVCFTEWINAGYSPLDPFFGVNFVTNTQMEISNENSKNCVTNNCTVEYFCTTGTQGTVLTDDGAANSIFYGIVIFLLVFFGFIYYFKPRVRSL